MKKIFTLLLLAAFFSIPRSAQAAVTWEVSDGTQLRINPNNPSDPTDLVAIPAGTEYCRPMCGMYVNNNGVAVIFRNPFHRFTASAYNNLWIKQCIYDVTSKTAKQFGSYNYSQGLNGIQINFPDDALRFRLVELVLGYNAYRDSYAITLQHTGLPLITTPNSTTTHPQKDDIIDYYSRIVITRDEAREKKVLNLNPETYNLIVNKSAEGIYRIHGLEIFENLEELYLQNNIALGRDAYDGSLGHGLVSSFTPDFTVFSTLKILDISNTNPYGYYSFNGNRYLPKSIEQFIYKNSGIEAKNNGGGVLISDFPNLRVLDLSGSPGITRLYCQNNPSLKTLDLSSLNSLYLLDCRNCALEGTLNLDNSPYLIQLHCQNNNISAITLHPDANLNLLDCKNNNLTSLNVPGTFRGGSMNLWTYWDSYYNVSRIYKVDRSEQAMLDCSGNGNLSSLALPDASGLKKLYCQDCSFSSLDLSACDSLKVLNARTNDIGSLDLSNSPLLEELYCQDNGMTSLALSPGATNLKRLECQRNNISVLNIPGKLEYRYDTYWKLSASEGYDAGVDKYITINNVRKKVYVVNESEGYVSEPQSYDGEVYCYAFDCFDHAAGRWMHYEKRDGYYDYYDEWHDESVTYTEIPAPTGYTAQQVTDTIFTGSSLGYLDCSANSPMETLTLPYAKRLETLYCYNNDLSSLDLSDCTSLQKLRMSHNKIPQIDLSNCKALVEIYAKNRIGEPGFANWKHGLTSLDCSGLTKLETVRLSRNKMTSLDMSGCSSLRTLTCDNQGGSDARTLEVLNLTGCSNLTSLDCQNNALTSLNLSTCTSLSPSGVTGYVQRAIKDVVVLDRDKICIDLPNGVTPTIENNGTISATDMDNYFGTWTGSGFDKTRNKVVRREGKTYLVIYDIGDDARGGTQTKYDVDFYGKKLKYQYALAGDNWDETLGGSLANSKKNDNVTVTIYPYVMYVNPVSKDVHSTEVTQQGKAPFYSGTIYLDYDAIVPAGATAYIAKKIKINQDLIYSTAGGGHQKVTADQLQLVPLVAGEGASEVVIPALTPVYIKSDTEFGLFSFDRNNHGGVEQALGYAQDGSDLIQDNIFRGVLQDSTITKYSVLSLGRGRPKGSDDSGYTTESRIGFWPSNNTKIPAHRVFIPMSELENAGIGSGSPGLLFSFMGNDEGTTTGIRPALINRNEGWYTINGIRLNGRPKEKGIYIHNGRKEVIR